MGWSKCGKLVGRDRLSFACGQVAIAWDEVVMKGVEVGWGDTRRWARCESEQREVATGMPATQWPKWATEIVGQGGLAQV